MAKSVLDYINMMATIEKNKRENNITYEEWCDIRRNGTPDEIAEAVERMEAMGGYENLG